MSAQLSGKELKILKKNFSLYKVCIAQSLQRGVNACVVVYSAGSEDSEGGTRH